MPRYIITNTSNIKQIAVVSLQETVCKRAEQLNLGSIKQFLKQSSPFCQKNQTEKLWKISVMTKIKSLHQTMKEMSQDLSISLEIINT